MAGLRGNGSLPSLPPPRPKSPPQYPDLYGKRRELAKVQMLEREIGFLEEELKSIEGLQPASRSCKEVADFVTGNADPLIPTTKKIRRSRRFWKWLWYQPLNSILHVYIRRTKMRCSTLKAQFYSL
ncbi:UNVERIFIED_CONTAM: Guanine nucleotide-binding protein subunit gamma 3 [Sesamum calycinum]|uniref:Guanine nucleotide-binding protein subunit gamma 3 n=1 Tax=Sesamum calycinum TaxID=2727403 RepID=A0AAW2J1F7_9LAMI